MLSKRLQDYLKQHRDINQNIQIEISKGTIEILGNFFYDFFVPNSWNLKDIEKIDNNKIIIKYFFIGVLKQSKQYIRSAI